MTRRDAPAEYRAAHGARRRGTRRTWPLWFALLCLVSGVIALSTQDTRTHHELDGLSAPQTRALLGRWFASAMDDAALAALDPNLVAGATPAERADDARLDGNDGCVGQRTVDYAFRPSGQLGFSADCTHVDGRRWHRDGVVAWPQEHEPEADGPAWRQGLHALYERLQLLSGPVHEVLAVDDALGLALVEVAGSGDVLLLSRQQRLDPVTVQRFLRRLRDDDQHRRPLA